MKWNRLAWLVSYLAPIGAALAWSTPAYAIVNGQLDSGDPSVEALDISAAGGGGLCTCTIVSPHVALTAAHCVDPDSVGPNPGFTVVFNSNGNLGTPYIDGKEAHFDPQFNLGDLQHGHDIAVIWLIDDATLSPESVTPTPPNRTPLSPALANGMMGLRVVGYGQTTNAPGAAGCDVGVKHDFDTVLSNFDSKFVYVGDSSLTTCHGDSGGPSLMNIGPGGAQVVVGVTSFGTDLSSTFQCAQSGNTTRVDAYVSSFVDPWIAVADPGWVPDHCKADGVCQWEGCATPDPDCATYPHCGADNICEFSGCAPPDTDCWAVINTGAASYGSPCQQDTDCTQGVCQKGFCTQKCDVLDADTCPSGYTCQTGSAGSFCFTAATTGGGGGTGGCSALPGGARSRHGGGVALGAVAMALGLALASRAARRRGGRNVPG